MLCRAEGVESVGGCGGELVAGRESQRAVKVRAGGRGGGAHLCGAVLLRQLDVLEHGLEVLHGLLGGRVQLEEVLVRVRVRVRG